MGNSIAVVIAARNAGKAITRALGSIAAQTSAPDEVLVVDDGSVDDTYKNAERYVSSITGLRVIKGVGKGPAQARNLGNRHVLSDYIAVLDADDWFETDTILQYRSFIENHPGSDLVYSDCKYVFGPVSIYRKYPVFRDNRQAIRRTFSSFFIPFKHSSCLYRRKSFEELGAYDESFDIKVDVDLFLRFLSGGFAVRKMDYCTTCHERHSGQISRKRVRGIGAYLRLIDMHESSRTRRVLYKTMRTACELTKIAVGWLL